MIRLYAFIIFCLCFYIFLHSRWVHSFKRAWHDKDLFPKKRRLTMFDVRRLLIKGERDLAIRVYCELFKTDSEEARHAIEEIERSIQPKDFES
jgi:hypothetical protein